MIKDNFLDAFKEVARIPHQSGQTAGILTFLKSYAQKRGLETMESGGNLIVTLPATKGYENEPPVIIQGHMDMVAEKVPGSPHDFARDSIPLRLSEDGEWLSADGTTLGGDDGVALAYMMMLMDDPEAEHPKIYCLFTRDEEIGLLGALALDCSLIEDAKYMLNLDSEAEGVLTCGSSGGEVISATYSYRAEPILGRLWIIQVSGLSGGHSGEGIDRGGAHAAKIISQILGHLCHTCQIRLVNLDCPGKDNVITSSGRAAFYSPVDKDVLINSFIQISKFVATAYQKTDPDIKIDLKQQNSATKVMGFTHKDTASILFNIEFVPYGPQIFTRDGILASSNIGSCIADNGELRMRMHLRFINTSSQELTKNKIIQFFAFTGAFFDILEYCPPWYPSQSEDLKEKALSVWNDLTGEEMQTQEMHATLECGVFSNNIPGMEIISFGPDILNIHTPEERLSLSSTVKVYTFLRELLKSFGHPENKEEEVTKARIQRTNGETLSVEELYANREPLPPECTSCEFASIETDQEE